mgnify:CR=1 FL=1
MTDECANEPGSGGARELQTATATRSSTTLLRRVVEGAARRDQERRQPLGSSTSAFAAPDASASAILRRLQPLLAISF